MAYQAGYGGGGGDGPPQQQQQQHSGQQALGDYHDGYGYSDPGAGYGQHYGRQYQDYGPPPPRPATDQGHRPGQHPPRARGGAAAGPYPRDPDQSAPGRRPPMGYGGRRDPSHGTDQELAGQMSGMALNSHRPRPHPESRPSNESYPAHGYYGHSAANGSRGPQPRDYGYGDSRQRPPPGQGHGAYGGVYDDGHGGSGPSGAPRDGFAPPGRSKTMPAQDIGVRHNMPPPLRADTTPYAGPAGRGVPPRPSTATGIRPPPQRIYPPNPQGPPQDRYGGGYGREPSSADDSFNSYFDAAPPRRGASFEQPQRGPHQVPRLHHAKSEANVREPQAAVFEMAGDIPSVPPVPRIQPYHPASGGANGHGGPGGYEPVPAAPSRGPSTSSGHANGHRPAGGSGFSGSDGASRTNTGLSQSSNPDALPSHPTPVRPGLMANSMVSMNDRPPPVRSYGGAGQAVPMPPPPPPPPQQQQQQQQQQAEGQPRTGPAEEPVTPQELERLRMVVKGDANDQDSALRLSRKLIEAAEVLAPRAPDPKQRTRTRDRYLADAHKILKKLANVQNPEAMFIMADGLGKGLFGHEPDNKEAFTLYQSAAKVGHAAAAYRTAVCCEIGHEEGGGTRKDPLKAMQWYKRAATLGDAPAMYKVGMILLKGLLGQPRNPREAVGWLKRAAERADAENPHALHELGLLYESAQPNDAMVRDEQYALSLFQQAAELGYKFSQFRLGRVFEYGLMGCPNDPRQSIYWYSKAAAQEEHQSELALSGWYLTGSDGVLGQSDTEAYLWARKAAVAGLAKAEYAMGYFTEVGIGVGANLEDAKRWYWRAAAQDFPKARERLEDLKRAGKNGRPRPRERISRSRIEKQQEGECSIM